MKKSAFLLLLFLVSCGQSTIENEYTSGAAYPYAPGSLGHEEVFDLTDVPEITISISSNQWNELLSNYDEDRMNELYVEADFSFTKKDQTTTVADVGFRIRGNGFSRARPERGDDEPHDPNDPDWNYAHFRVNFDKFVDDQEFMGLDSLNLKFFNGDPSYVREIYCYDLFHRFGVVNAPRSSYVRLSIRIKEDPSAAYYGVYEMVEPVDKTFIKSRFPDSSDGYLWKCLWPAPLVYSWAEDVMGIENEDEDFAYDLKTNKKDFEEAKEQFLDFMMELNGLEGEEFEEWIDGAFDVEGFLRAYAVNVAVGMWDDYWGNMNNFYMYFDEEGVGHFIAYDYDNTLGTGWYALDRDPFNWGDLDEKKPLMYKILQVEEYRNYYADCLQELVDPENGYLDAAASTERVNYWRNLIEEYVPNDIGYDDEIRDETPNWSQEQVLLFSGDLNSDPPNYFSYKCDVISDVLKRLDKKGWDSIFDEDYLSLIPAEMSEMAENALEEIEAE